MYNLILFLIIVLIVIYFTNYTKETFDVSPSNSFSVNENKLEIHEKIHELREKYITNIKNTWGENGLQSLNKSIFAKDYIYKKLLEDFVKDDLNNKFENTKIESGEIEKMGIKDDGNSVIFNFEILLINRIEMWVFPVEIWVKFNIANLCKEKNNCMILVEQQKGDNLLTDNDIKNNFLLEFVLPIDNKYYTVKPKENGFDYFRIKNNLYLTEPFLTSREEMRLKNI